METIGTIMCPVKKAINHSMHNPALPDCMIGGQVASRYHVCNGVDWMWAGAGYF
jgi:hypothetical protein